MESCRSRFFMAIPCWMFASLSGGFILKDWNGWILSGPFRVSVKLGLLQGDPFPLTISTTTNHLRACHAGIDKTFIGSKSDFLTLCDKRG